MSATVIPFRPRANQSALEREPRVLAAFAAQLARCPPKPPGLAACVAYLQEPLDQLPTRQMAVRALAALRANLFVAPGRQEEMGLLWREALATACYSRLVAQCAGFDAPLLTAAGLLHRTGEIAALRALAHAEHATSQRIVGPVMQEILEASDDELVSRVTRGWSLPGEVRLTIIHWREQQDSLSRPEGVTLLMLAQSLATELVHAATCPPGLVEAATESLRLPLAMAARARQSTSAIEALLAAG